MTTQMLQVQESSHAFQSALLRVVTGDSKQGPPDVLAAIPAVLLNKKAPLIVASLVVHYAEHILPHSQGLHAPARTPSTAGTLAHTFNSQMACPTSFAHSLYTLSLPHKLLQYMESGSCQLMQHCSLVNRGRSDILIRRHQYDQGRHKPPT